jgi:hypothetical protein
MHTKFLDKNFNGRVHLRDIGLCGRFVLKWLSDKQNMMWAGLICLRRGLIFAHCKDIKGVDYFH